MIGSSSSGGNGGTGGGSAGVFGGGAPCRYVGNVRVDSARRSVDR